LDLPSEFNQYESQIERVKLCGYEEYLQLVQECDINIAPLEPGEFNDAKSNIKFLEASALNLPSVCSPRSAFRSAITSGENGFLCDTEDEWVSALSLLITDAEVRTRVASCAFNFVRETYSP